MLCCEVLYNINMGNKRVVQYLCECIHDFVCKKGASLNPQAR